MDTNRGYPEKNGRTPWDSVARTSTSLQILSAILFQATMATVLLMLKIIPSIDPIYFLLNAPIAIGELLLALVLTVRNFNFASIQFTPGMDGGLE